MERRWSRQARGHPGDLLLRLKQGEIWMLTVYAKNEADSIPAHLLRRIREEIDG